MTTITKLKNALAALRKNGKYLPVDFDYHFEAIEGLRSVIAEMEAGERNCCVYCASDNEGVKSTYFDQTCDGCVRRMSAPAQPKPEPVAGHVSDVRIAMWASRHDFSGSQTDLRCAFEDARSLTSAQPKAEPAKCDVCGFHAGHATACPYNHDYPQPKAES